MLMAQCFVIEQNGFTLSITESEVTNALLRQGGLVTEESVAMYLKQKMDEYIRSKTPVVVNTSEAETNSREQQSDTLESNQIPEGLNNVLDKLNTHRLTSNPYKVISDKEFQTMKTDFINKAESITLPKIEFSIDWNGKKYFVKKIIANLEIDEDSSLEHIYFTTQNGELPRLQINPEIKLLLESTQYPDQQVKIPAEEFINTIKAVSSVIADNPKIKELQDSLNDLSQEYVFAVPNLNHPDIKKELSFNKVFTKTYLNNNKAAIKSFLVKEIGVNLELSALHGGNTEMLKTPIIVNGITYNKINDSVYFTSKEGNKLFLSTLLDDFLSVDFTTSLDQKLIAYLQERDVKQKERNQELVKQIIVPVNANESNSIIKETEDAIYLMNDGQQEAYEWAVKGMKAANNKSNIYSSESSKIIFTNPLASMYSNIIPQVMWDNMFAVIGDAGSGKTTLINKIKSDLENENKYNKKNILVAAPTHNAATVTQESLGLSGEYTKEGNVLTYTSLVGRSVPLNGKLELTDELTYLRRLSRNPNEAFSNRDYIIFDEYSMMSVQMLQDVMTRLEQEIRGGFSGKIPVMLFTGDYKQLPDIEENSEQESLNQENTLRNPEAEGIISATLITDTSKYKKLVQVMRAKNGDLLDINESLAVEIERRRQEFLNGINNPKAVDLTNYESFTNKSSKNILIGTSEAGFIDDYTDYLAKNNNPYGMFWLHYNKLSNSKTQDILKRIRKSYFEKLLSNNTINNMPDLEDNYNTALFDGNVEMPFYRKLSKSIINTKFKEGDYIQFTDNLPIINKKEISSEKEGQFKPKSRYKLIKEEIIKMTSSQFSSLLKNSSSANLFSSSIPVQVKKITVVNKQGEVRYAYFLESHTVRTNFNKTTNRMDIFFINVETGVIDKSASVPYPQFVENIAGDLNRIKNVYELFSPHYIGSSHTAQGAQFNSVIVGETNIKANRSNPKIGEKTIMSSFYTIITRATDKLLILKSPGSNILNNQDVFEFYKENPIIDKTQSSNSDGFIYTDDDMTTEAAPGIFVKIPEGQNNNTPQQEVDKALEDLTC